MQKRALPFGRAFCIYNVFPRRNSYVVISEEKIIEILSEWEFMPFFPFWIQFYMSISEKQSEIGNIFMEINILLTSCVIMDFFC